MFMGKGIIMQPSQSRYLCTTHLPKYGEYVDSHFYHMFGSLWRPSDWQPVAESHILAPQKLPSKFKESFACNNLAITVQLLSIRYSILSIPTIWALRADSSGLEAQHEASVCINLLLRDPGCHRYVSRTWGALLSEFGTNNHKRQYVQALMITWSNWKQRCSRLTVGSMAASKLRPLFWSGSDKRYRDPWPCVLLSVLAQCHCHCARFLSHGSRT